MKLYKVGQIITFDKVWGWSKLDNRPTGMLRQFVITKAGNRNEIKWYPLIIENGRYKTVVRVPNKLRIRKCK